MNVKMIHDIIHTTEIDTSNPVSITITINEQKFTYTQLYNIYNITKPFDKTLHFMTEFGIDKNDGIKYQIPHQIMIDKLIEYDLITPDFTLEYGNPSPNSYTMDDKIFLNFNGIKINLHEIIKTIPENCFIRTNDIISCLSSSFYEGDIEIININRKIFISGTQYGHRHENIYKHNDTRIIIENDGWIGFTMDIANIMIKHYLQLLLNKVPAIEHLLSTYKIDCYKSSSIKHLTQSFSIYEYYNYYNSYECGILCSVDYIDKLVKRCMELMCLDNMIIYDLIIEKHILKEHISGLNDAMVEKTQKLELHDTIIVNLIKTIHSLEKDMFDLLLMKKKKRSLKIEDIRKLELEPKY